MNRKGPVKFASATSSVGELGMHVVQEAAFDLESVLSVMQHANDSATCQLRRACTSVSSYSSNVFQRALVRSVTGTDLSKQVQYVPNQSFQSTNTEGILGAVIRTNVQMPST